MLDKTKTVTRRLGWRYLEWRVKQDHLPLPVMQPVVKGQGLKKGESVVKLGGLIQVLDARIEPLNALTGGTYTARMAKRECVREGFPEMSPRQFVEFFCQFNGCPPGQLVVRIEFRYL